MLPGMRQELSPYGSIAYYDATYDDAIKPNRVPNS